MIKFFSLNSKLLLHKGKGETVSSVIFVPESTYPSNFFSKIRFFIVSMASFSGEQETINKVELI